MSKVIVNIDTVKYISTKGDMLEVIDNDNNLINIRISDIVYYNDEIAFYDGTRFVPIHQEDEKLVDKNGEEIKEGDYIAAYFNNGIKPYYGRLDAIENHIEPTNCSVYKSLVIKTVNLSEACFNYYSSTLNTRSIYEIEKITFDDIKKLCVTEQQHFIDVTKDNIKAQRKQLKYYKQKMLNLKRLKTFPTSED